jgi:hypothetical protein
MLAGANIHYDQQQLPASAPMYSLGANPNQGAWAAMQLTPSAAPPAAAAVFMPAAAIQEPGRQMVAAAAHGPGPQKAAAAAAQGPGPQIGTAGPATNFVNPFDTALMTIDFGAQGVGSSGTLLLQPGAAAAATMLPGAALAAFAAAPAYAALPSSTNTTAAATEAAVAAGSGSRSCASGRPPADGWLTAAEHDSLLDLLLRMDTSMANPVDGPDYTLADHLANQGTVTHSGAAAAAAAANVAVSAAAAGASPVDGSKRCLGVERPDSPTELAWYLEIALLEAGAQALPAWKAVGL